MRVSPFAMAAFVLSLIGLGLAVGVQGEHRPLIIGATAAIALASFAVLLYTMPHIHTHGIRTEDFDTWVELGETAAGLRGMKSRDKQAAAQIVAADMNSLAINAGLLDSRLSFLYGKHGYDKLTKDKLHNEAKRLAKAVHKNAKKIAVLENWSPDNMPTMLEEFESCASGYDRIANKLHHYEGERPEIVKANLEPLRRTAEKLSANLRSGRSNLENYFKRAGKSRRA